MLEKELLLTISGSCSFSSLLQWNAMEHGMEQAMEHGTWHGNAMENGMAMEHGMAHGNGMR